MPRQGTFGLSTAVAACGWCALAVTTQAAGQSVSDDQCVVWLPGSGFWSDPSNWGMGMVPGTQLDVPEIVIDGLPVHTKQDHGSTGDCQDRRHGTPHESIVWLDVDAQMRSLYMGPEDTVHMLDGVRCAFDSDVMPMQGETLYLYNTGEFHVEAASNVTTLLVGEAHTLVVQGAGRLVLENQQLARIVGETGAETLVLDGSVLEGTGVLGAGTLAIVNKGVIEANVPFNRLAIDASADGVENLGVIRSRNFGRIELIGGDVKNTNGLLEARSASVIELNNVHVTGGRFETDPDSVIRCLLGDAVLEQVRSDGNVEVVNRRIEFRGTITNNGTIYMVGDATRGEPDAGEGFNDLIISQALGDVVLDGDGELGLQDSTVWGGALMSSAKLINGPNHTISGGGSLGNNGLLIRNEGTIRADGDVPILIDPTDGTAFENPGTVRVVTRLFMLDGSFSNGGHFVVEQGGEMVLLPGATLTNAFAGGLIGGHFIVRGNMELIAVPELDYNQSDVTLDGPTSRFQRFDTIQSNLGLIRLLNGRRFTTLTNFNNAGAIDVGSTSVFETNGKLTLNNASRVELEVGDSSAGSGTLEVNGRLSMNGVLELKLAPGAQWNPGTEYELITAIQFTGSFDQIIAPGRVDVSIEDGMISFTALPPCLGELDGDDTVGVGDLTILLDAWGDCPADGPCPADLDESGDVSVMDLILLLDAWGDCPAK